MSYSRANQLVRESCDQAVHYLALARAEAIYACCNIQRHGLTSSSRLSLPKRRVDHSDEAVVRKWFFQEIGCTRLHGLDGKRNIAMSGYDQDGECATVCFQAFQ
jgi:hypothetical protein